MASAPLTEAEVDEVLSESMRIEGPVRWVQKSNDVWAEATLQVRHPHRDVSLSLKITVNLLATRKFSFSLLLDSAHRIVGVDVGSGHENRHTDSNRWVDQPHEHRWTDACHGSWARDLDAFPGTLREAFLAFCERMRIEFGGVWSDPPPAQLGLDE
jgi:hypothetical protein